MTISSTSLHPGYSSRNVLEDAFTEEILSPSTDLQENSVTSVPTNITNTTVSKLQDQDGHVICLIESRGNVSQIGIAAFSCSSTSLYLYQLADCSSYDSVLSILAFKPPSALVLNNASLNASSPSRLYEVIRREFPDVNVFLMPRSDFNHSLGYQNLKGLIMSKFEKILDLEFKNRVYSISAANALLKLLEQQLVLRPQSLSIYFEASKDRIQLDFHTIKNLEIVKSLDENCPKSTLMSACDRTSTPMGKKELRNRLLQPFLDINPIINSQDAIEFILQDGILIAKISEKLKTICNFDQIICSLTCSRKLLDIDAFEAKITRIFQIKNSFNALRDISGFLNFEKCPEMISKLKKTLSSQYIEDLLENLNEILNEDVQLGPKGSLLQHKKCFAIKNGIDSLLDTSRKAFSEISSDAYEYVEALSSNNVYY
jgi:DNA mismatch repair protein MSH4